MALTTQTSEDILGWANAVNSCTSGNASKVCPEPNKLSTPVTSEQGVHITFSVKGSHYATVTKVPDIIGPVDDALPTGQEAMTSITHTQYVSDSPSCNNEDGSWDLLTV